MPELTPHERLIVALDLPDAAAARILAARLAPRVGAVKVGLELVNAAGPAIIEQLAADGARVFYDAKFHDIPNTVAGAVRQAARRGAWMLNVHASGGGAMLRAAVEAAREVPKPPLVIAVTVLTSIDQATLRDELGVPASPAEQVVRLARLAQDCGLDGVVASPLEAGAVRAACGDGFLVVTPGIRPAGAASDDQQRLATPARAVASGADYLVVGRPITQAPDPLAAARAIAEELG